MLLLLSILDISFINKNSNNHFIYVCRETIKLIVKRKSELQSVGSFLSDRKMLVCEGGFRCGLNSGVQALGDDR